MKTTINRAISILFQSVSFCMTIHSQTHINLLPVDNIDVGEELYFDALYYKSLLGPAIQCEWDFGDGYALYANSGFTFFETGICGVHSYTSPGEYKIRLTISEFNMSANPPARGSLLATDSVSVIVSGQAVIPGFELLHAPFHARTAQYLYAIVPAGYNPAQVTVKVENAAGNYSRELIGTTEDNKQKFLLQNSSLPSGNYFVTANLNDGKTIVSTIKEKFSKPYEGSPAVGINENNAFVLNGAGLFLPIGPFMCNKDFFPLWSRVSNTLHTEGWYASHDSSTWNDFLNKAYDSDFMCIGPTIWKGHSGSEYYLRNSNPDSLLMYVRHTKNNPGLLCWNWEDEPNMGGRHERVPAAVLAGWSYRTRLEDSQHPVGQQYYGFDWFPYYNPRSGNNGYNYMRSAYLFGGEKTFVGDFFTHDAYLMEYKEHVSLNYADRGAVDLWLENLDNFNWNVSGLAPLGTIIETQNVETFDRISDIKKWDAGSASGDVRTQAWSSLIHNMKFVGYFINFAPVPAENLSVLGELKEATGALAPVILGETSAKAVTHNATTRGNRVDVMVREYENDIYIFAARITEPESEWSEVAEADTIDFQLNTGTNASVAYDEFKKYRWGYVKLDATEGQTEFNCTVPEGGIEPGSLIVSAVEKSVATGEADSLYDRWTGKGYPKVYDMQGNLKYGLDNKEGSIYPLFSWKGVTGTVDYLSGQVHLIFATGIPKGSCAVQIAYAPSNRQAGQIQISNGVITDKMERNAVRIYRITQTAGNKNEIYRPIFLECYPNPSAGSIKMSYELQKSSLVNLKIYDCMGRVIIMLINEKQSTGIHTIEWYGNNADGQRVNSGIYFCCLDIDGDYSATKKIVLLK